MNPKTVAKRPKRETVEDMKTGPKAPRSTVLTGPEETMIVAFRLHTLLPLEDCLYALHPSISHLTRSRCTGAFNDEPCRAIGPSDTCECISRLTVVEGRSRDIAAQCTAGQWASPNAGASMATRSGSSTSIARQAICNANPPRGDIAKVQAAKGKLYIFVGIERTAKFAVAQCVATADRRTARELLQHMLEAVPYQVHTIITDRAVGTPLVREKMARGEVALDFRPLCSRFRCLIPWFDGAILSEEWKEALWDKFVTGAPRSL